MNMIYLLQGEERFLIKREIKRFIEKYITFEKEMNTVYYDASKTAMEDIISDALTLPFFSEYKAVIIQNPVFLTTSSSDANVEAFQRYIENPNPTTILIIDAGETNLDNRKKIVKLLTKSATVLKYNRFNDYERNRFIDNEIKNRKMTFSKDALREFQYRVGYAAERILSEIEKLSVFSSHIEIEDVKALVIRPLDDNIFDVFNHIIHKNFKKAYQLWKDLDALNVDSITLISNLAAQYRFLLQVSILYHQGLNQNEIAKELGAHYYRVQKNLELVAYANEDKIMSTLNELAILDQNIKQGKIDKKQGFEFFLIHKAK